MQSYKNHRINAEGLVILTEGLNGTEVLVPFDSARQIVKDLRRQLGDFHEPSDDRRHWPKSPDGVKYGSTERQ
jgi:hypothetical protein